MKSGSAASPTIPPTTAADQHIRKNARGDQDEGEEKVDSKGKDQRVEQDHDKTAYYAGHSSTPQELEDLDKWRTELGGLFF